MDIYMVGGLLLVSGVLIAFSLWPKGGMKDSDLRRRMMGRRAVDEASVIQKKAKESATQKVLERMTPLASRAAVLPRDQDRVSMLRVKLSNAGFRRMNAPTLFLASKTVLAGGFALAAIIWMLSTGRSF